MDRGLKEGLTWGSMVVMFMIFVLLFIPITNLWAARAITIILWLVILGMIWGVARYTTTLSRPTDEHFENLKKRRENAAALEPDDILKLKKQGWNNHMIANFYDVWDDDIRRLIKRSSTGSNMTTSYKALVDSIDAEEIKGKWDMGWSIQKIADHYGIYEATVEWKLEL